jgi:hypothetical protein
MAAWPKELPATQEVVVQMRTRLLMIKMQEERAAATAASGEPVEMRGTPI